MGRGKHSLDSSYSFESKFEKEMDYKENNNLKTKIIIIAIVVVVILSGVGFACYKVFYNNEEEIPVSTATPVEDEEKMLETVNGYDVLGKIIIEELDVEQYILDSAESSALENGVGKLYGGSLNSYGNFCIAGHNYDNMFKRLEELSIGDTFKIVDTDLDETIYQITQIYSAEPEDLTSLLQDENKIEITLITCDNAATTRLIIKAEEKNENNSSTNTINTNSVLNNAIENTNSEENV